MSATNQAVFRVKLTAAERGGTAFVAVIAQVFGPGFRGAADTPGLGERFAVPNRAGDYRLMGMSYQGSKAPGRGSAHAGHEGHADQAPWQVALAPALEHGDESSKEEDDCDDSKSFEPHVPNSLG